MCGILGYIDFKNNIPEAFEQKFKSSLDLLSHRGPDASGIFVDGKMILGHKRLSIIDVSDAANQPFVYGDYILVFNGEIYNFAKIRDTLKSLGYKFQTTSDTEVLLCSYVEWGMECTKKFDGMWAFAIYDKVKGCLFLSRDRFGEKPLVFFHDDRGFVFSSEIPPMLGLMDTTLLKPDYEKLSNFNLYNFRHIPSPYTAYKDIYKLEPGYNMMIDINTGKAEKNKYFQVEKRQIKKNYVDTLHKELKNSVLQTCFADVSVGILLSGGVDSALITALLGNMKSDIITYSIGYDKNDPEIIRAHKIAKILGVKNKTIYFKDYIKKINLFDLLKRNVRFIGEPLVLFQVIYTDCLLQEMKKDGVKVAVGGNAADELFYGYDGMNKLYLLSFLLNIVDKLRIKGLLYKIFKKDFLNFTPGEFKSSRYSNKLMGRKYIKNKYKKFCYEKEFQEYSKEMCSDKLIDIFSWLGLRIENEHSITIVNDLSGSINSMELRTPFLNKNIVDMAVNIPLRFKIRSFFSKKYNKYILKKILENYLPKDLIYTKKMGFGHGINYDNFIFDHKEEIDSYIKNTVKKLDLYEDEIVGKMYGDYISGKMNDKGTIIQILMVCVRYEMFIK